MLIKIAITFALLVLLVFAFGWSLRFASMPDGEGGPWMLGSLILCGLAAVGIIATWAVL